MPPRESRAKRESLQPEVYRYGIIGPLPHAVVAEIRRGHIARNAETAIYRGTDEEISAIYAAVPSAAQALEAADAAAAEVADLRTQIRARKSAARSRRPDPDLSAALDAARQRLTEAQAAFKAAKAAVRDASRGEVKAVEKNAQAAVKALYPEATSGALFEGDPVLNGRQGGLYWATFNMVTAKQRTAHSKVIKDRTAGRHAEQKFRRWDGGGTVAVQLQRQAADPPRTPQMLADRSGKWASVALLVPVASGKRRHGPAAQLRFRVGSGASKELVTVPLKMHRPLPEGCDIPQIEVTCRRQGHHFTASAAITVLVPAPPQRPADTGTAAVHAGWRAVPGGGLRVAVIAGAEGPPPEITWLVGGSHGDGGRSARRGQVENRRKKDRRKIPVIITHEGWHEVILPPELRDFQAHIRSLQSIRDRNMEPVRAAVAAHLAAHPEHKEVIDPKGSADRWQSPGQFAGALRRLEESGTDSCEPLAAMIAAYLKQDRHLEDWQTAEQSRILNWRRDAYRKIAAWATGSAARVVADGWEMTRRRPGDSEEETVQEKMARANAVLAAPGELRQMVSVAAGRRGVAVADAPDGVSGTHHGCAAGAAGVLPAEERSAGVAVTCRGCGRQVDQDVNALRGMLAAPASGEVVT